MIQDQSFNRCTLYDHERQRVPQIATKMVFFSLFR